MTWKVRLSRLVSTLSHIVFIRVDKVCVENLDVMYKRIRYKKGKIVGIAVLNAKKRFSK